MIFFEATRLDMLRYTVGIEISNAYGLASWVCDWSRRPIPPLLNYSLFDASDGREFRTKQTIDRILTVEVCKIDMVCITGKFIGQGGPLRERLECLEAWWSLAEIEKSNEKFAIWTTILGGCLDDETRGWRRILPEDLFTAEAWWKLAISSKEQGDYCARMPLEDRKMQSIDEQISASMPYLKFWLTSQGSLGLGRQTVGKGDEVFIVKGSRVPLIFRPIEGTLLPQFGLSERKQGYLFVSECHLHGFMDGEAVKPDTKWQRVHLC